MAVVYTGYWIERHYIYGPEHSEQFWIEKNFIYEPESSGEFWIEKNRIYGPDENVPWLRVNN